MMETPAAFYVTGGTLRYDAPSYVARRADDELYDGLHGLGSAPQPLLGGLVRRSNSLGPVPPPYLTRSWRRGPPVFFLVRPNPPSRGWGAEYVTRPRLRPFAPSALFMSNSD